MEGFSGPVTPAHNKWIHTTPPRNSYEGGCGELDGGEKHIRVVAARRNLTRKGPKIKKDVSVGSPSGVVAEVTPSKLIYLADSDLRGTLMPIYGGV